ncbi:hypothetical protein [Actinomadura bangladeshensis]|uniref:Uncharacterized protein n=1 Tax=Actinomadura bangladeshensis TaxID=453573 RepID=A0A4R4P2A6_9ACTN|nr:hypothetical protein [Actinomadura bangladeshensis]TDC15734.1 hypothetical protein E1284_14740 [Actinomadura bangladeshensis]
METNTRRAKKAVKVYAAFSTAALVTVIVASSTGHTVNTFMWVRALLLPVVAVPIYRTAVLTSRGSQRAFERLRAVAIVLPIAIIGVDLIPGVCPPWYTAMQIVCMLPVLYAALTLRTTSPDNR